MNCKSARRQMALAVGEDLTPAESQELQNHLLGCPSCQKSWEQQRNGFAVLQCSRTREIHPKSDSVWPALATRLKERELNSPRGEFNGWFAALAVTAACVLVFVFSQDTTSFPVVSQRNSTSSFGSMPVSSRPRLDDRKPQRPWQDDVQSKRVYDVAPQP